MAASVPDKANRAALRFERRPAMRKDLASDDETLARACKKGAESAPFYVVWLSHKAPKSYRPNQSATFGA